MYRKIIRYLKEWKENEYRKPLILQGARQVGKTYSVLEFGRTHYENVAYFNFETNPKLNATFEEDFSPDYLIPVLSHIAGQTIVREKTLIVFDEVQLCEWALTSLKYFCENAPDYHIIVAGSLLAVAVNRAEFSFPVGKVDIKTLYPMDMEEFLLALGEEGLVEQIKQCFLTDTPLPSALHDMAMQLYRQYLVTGGMPECVMQYVQTKDNILVRHTQDTILASYLNDINAFKIYVSDLGLLCAKKNLVANDVLYMVEELNDFKGGMAENYVNVQLTINGYQTFYWESERGAEIDFVIQRDGQLIPVEVKSADNTRAESLRVYMQTYQPAYAIKLSAKNFGFGDGKKTVPLYAAFCI